MQSVIDQRASQTSHSHSRNPSSSSSISTTSTSTCPSPQTPHAILSESSFSFGAINKQGQELYGSPTSVSSLFGMNSSSNNNGMNDSNATVKPISIDPGWKEGYVLKSPTLEATQSISRNPFNAGPNPASATSPSVAGTRFSFSAGNASRPIPPPQQLVGTNGRRPSVSAVLFGTSPPTPLSIPGRPASPPNPSTLGSSALSPPAGWGTGLSRTRSGGTNNATGVGVVDDKVGRGQGVLRRLSLSSGFGKPNFRKSPPASEVGGNPFEHSVPPPSTTSLVAEPNPVFSSESTYIPPSSASVPESGFDSHSLPSSAFTGASSYSASGTAKRPSYSNPFSGVSGMDDHHDEHDHDSSHEYERSFGGVSGGFFNRGKTIHGTGAGSMAAWKEGRRASELSGSMESTTSSGGADSNGMRPRRVSFGWTGFTKSSPGSTNASALTEGLNSGPKVDDFKAPRVPVAQTGAGAVDGLPDMADLAMPKVGRGRSGSIGGGKKRSVSPMGEHLLRGNGHF